MENETNTVVKDNQNTTLNKKMKNCKTCGIAIAKNAKRCPACGAKNKKPIYKRVWFWILVCLVVFIAVDIIVYKPPLNNPAVVKDNYGETTEMLSGTIISFYKENYQSALDRFGKASAEITATVSSVGKTYLDSINNHQYSYVKIELEHGWTLEILEDSFNSLLKELKKGDTIHIKSKIHYDDISNRIVFGDIIIDTDNNIVFDNSSVSIVQK